MRGVLCRVIAWGAPLASLALASVLAGCSEYSFGTSGKPELGTSTSPLDTDPPPVTTPDPTVPDTTDQPDVCSTDPLPGFDGTSDPACALELATGTFTPVVKWDVPVFGGPSGDYVMSAPIVVQVTDDDGDGDIDPNDTPDIVFVSYGWYDTVLRAVDGATGVQHWAVTGYGLQGQGGVAAGDIDGDGVVEIVSLTPVGAAVFENDGTLKWLSSNLSGHIYGISDVAAISDMDHDGHPEIIAGNAILNSEDGSLQGAGSLGFGGVAPAGNVGSCAFAVDIDQDGTEEVITGNTAYNPDGSVKWYNGLADGYPAVGDFDGDGLGEVAVVGQAELRLLDTDGTLLGSVAIPGATLPHYGGPPTIADFDGDGEPEIGVAAGSQYSVFEGDGTIRWQAATQDASSGNTGSAVFDFEGDGAAEAVYADETRLWVFDGATGAVKLESTEHSNGTWLEYPVIADIDGDGHVEIVVANTPYLLPKGGLTVFTDLNDSWQPGRKIWNQYAYFITNVNDDGTIPVTAAPNWTTYNNFRSGDLSSADGLKAPDLAPLADLCDIECDRDRVVVYVQAGNLGASDVLASDAPTVQLYAVEAGVRTLIAEQALPAGVMAGKYDDSVVFVVDDPHPERWDALVAVVSSSATECDDTNNEVVIAGPICP